MHHPSASQGVNVPLGIVCITAGILFLTLSDGIAKWLGAQYDPFQLLFLRNLLSLPIIGAIIWVRNGPDVMRTRYLRVHLFRGALNVIAASCFYMGLTLLPFADASAISFTAPIFITAISAFVFDERVTIRAWIVVLAGFVGVVLIIRPGTASFHWGALFPLITAISYAAMMVTARRIGPEESMATTIIYIMAGQLVFSAPPLIWLWTPVADAIHFVGFVGMGLCGTLGIGLITQAFRIAPASVVAPFEYSGLIWATMLGWLIWQEFPGYWAYLGMVLIAVSGAYVSLEMRVAAVRRRRANE